MLNSENWSLYKDSEEGKKVIALFDLGDHPEYDKIQEIAKYMENKRGDFPSDYNSEAFIVLETNVSCMKTPHEPTTTREDFEKFITTFNIVDYTVDEKGELQFHEDQVLLPSNRYRDKNWLMTFLSMALYINNPSMYKPLFYQTRFPIIMRNCDALNIELPPIPRTKDYKQYMMYYWDICQVWNEFQKENNLSDAEFCACLYDFAPMLVTPTKPSELPNPTNVWLVGAALGDFKFLDTLGAETDDNPEQIWQCNEKTKRGDLIVMYCRSPRSYIHSVWRANTDGIFNPFDYYQCRTTVCEGVKIPPITIKELREDAYLSQIPIVRKNLQGVNGVELSPKDYSEIIRYVKDRGDKVDMFPKLFETAAMDFGEIKIEKDVEEKILIPILNRLGYSDSDYTRQLSQKAGRGLKAIPDFVFLPQGEKHFASAPLVIEAKLDMSPMAERINAFSQCLSYARMLRSKLMAICDKERLVVFSVDGNGSADRNNPVFEQHWTNIYTNEQIGAKLKQLIGKDVVKTK